MMKENLFRMKNGKYENQLFIQFLILVTVPLLILGTITYYIYVKGEERRNRASLEATCQNLAQTYEHVFSSIRDYYLDVTATPEYQWLKQQEEVPYSSYSNLKAAMSRLQGTYYLQGYTENYCYINVENGWVFNSYGMMPIEELSNGEDLQSYLEQEAAAPQSVRWMNRLGEVAPASPSVPLYRILNLTGENLVIKETRLSGEVRHLLLIRLNDIKLQELSKNYRNAGYNVLIVSDGKILYESDPRFTETLLEGGNADADILKGKYGRYQVSSVEIAGQDLQCYLGYDIATFQKNGQVFLIFTALFTLVMAVLLVIIRYIALYFSEPVISLQNQLDVQNRRIQELFVANMLKGGMTEETVLKNLTRLEKPPCACYRMVGMMAKAPEGGQLELKDLGEEARIGIPEDIRAQLFLPPVTYKNILLFLVGAEDEFQLDEKTAILYKQMKDSLTEQTGYAIASGISQTFESLTCLSRARDECSEALHNRQHRADQLSSMVLYDDYRTKNRTRNAYDIIIEEELTNAISGGNEEEARHLLSLSLERLERMDIIGLERSLYVIHLLTAILSVPDNAGIPIGDIFDREQSNLINQACQLYNNRELIAYMDREILTPILRTFASKNQSDTSELVRKIIRLIQDSKGTISLNECADLLNYHPNYIGKVLKAEKGVTFTELANEERLELAKYMLLTTDESIADISAKLSYNNVQNFIRFFKSHVGNTPAAFRKSHRH